MPNGYNFTSGIHSNTNKDKSTAPGPGIFQETQEEIKERSGIREGVRRGGHARRLPSLSHGKVASLYGVLGMCKHNLFQPVSTLNLVNLYLSTWQPKSYLAVRSTDSGVSY